MGKWVIGLDTLSRHAGAIEFAAWWQQHATSDAPTFVGLHVHRLFEPPADTEGTFDWISAEAREPSFDDVRTAVHDISVRTIETSQVAQTLEEEAKLLSASGVLVGRKAGADEASAIRLGSVARRMLRRLNQPVTVVPPDWSSNNVPTGPVIVATDLEPNSVAALRYAQKFAQSCGRRLVAVHVARDVERYFHYARTDDRFAVLRDRVLTDLRARTKRWLEDHGAADVHAVAVLGDAAERVLHVAVEQDALLIACGSRGLSLPERMLQASVGSTVAAFAPCPVTVVAPEPS